MVSVFQKAKLIRPKYVTLGYGFGYRRYWNGRGTFATSLVAGEYPDQSNT